MKNDGGLKLTIREKINIVDENSTLKTLSNIYMYMNEKHTQGRVPITFLREAKRDYDLLKKSIMKKIIKEIK